eukprot:GILJ01006618.1.p2 GENE.GILJ01006618.1~~GILJ01006618.1.p2  ORF type:complete len:441 (-),score=52.19 GILJ01006618.1:2316-3638(-)
MASGSDMFDIDEVARIRHERQKLKQQWKVLHSKSRRRKRSRTDDISLIDGDLDLSYTCTDIQDQIISNRSTLAANMSSPSGDFLQMREVQITKLLCTYQEHVEKLRIRLHRRQRSFNKRKLQRADLESHRIFHLKNVELQEVEKLPPTQEHSPPHVQPPMKSSPSAASQSYQQSSQLTSQAPAKALAFMSGAASASSTPHQSPGQRLHPLPLLNQASTDSPLNRLQHTPGSGANHAMHPFGIKEIDNRSMMMLQSPNNIPQNMAQMVHPSLHSSTPTSLHNALTPSLVPTCQFGKVPGECRQPCLPNSPFCPSHIMFDPNQSQMLHNMYRFGGGPMYPGMGNFLGNSPGRFQSDPYMGMTMPMSAAPGGLPMVVGPAEMLARYSGVGVFGGYSGFPGTSPRTTQPTLAAPAVTVLPAIQTPPHLLQQSSPLHRPADKTLQ